jgi:hypothetical protein
MVPLRGSRPRKGDCGATPIPPERRPDRVVRHVTQDGQTKKPGPGGQQGGRGQQHPQNNPAGEIFLQRLAEIMPRFGSKRQVVDIANQIESDISAYLVTITAMNAASGSPLQRSCGLRGWADRARNPICVRIGLQRRQPTGGIPEHPLPSEAVSATRIGADVGRGPYPSAGIGGFTS